MSPEDVARRLIEIEEETARGLGMDVSTSRPAASALRDYLAAYRAREPTVEAKISLPDPMLQEVFEGLCARYGIPVYRKPRQRKTTFTVAGPKPFVHDVLGAMFQKMADAFDELFIAQTASILESFAATDAQPSPRP